MDAKDIKIIKSMLNLKTDDLQTIADTVCISKSSVQKG